jgi:hypothetical protein
LSPSPVLADMLKIKHAQNATAIQLMTNFV